MASRRAERIGIIVLLAAVLAAGIACQKREPGAASGEHWAERVAAAYGGHDAFERTRTLAFDFVSYEDGAEKARFHHVMALAGGPCLYETDAMTFARSPFLDDQTRSWKAIGLTLPPGRLAARVDRIRRTGDVRVNGEQQSPELVRRVVERINNDSFWLLLPFQLHDPGVRLAEKGPVTLPDGRPAVALSLGFRADAGATPADRWTVFVDPTSARILKTRVDLQNSSSFVEAEWSGSIKTGALDLADQRTIGKRVIRFERLSATPVN
ncbi:MAG: hypothetical protein IPK07_31910 [Deltaproteobacteria bacterium]|jgi:hypothetical protein|nr:hypothetical protein [Deltaproteobacteria bacterium]